jgi:rhodanese-related sulfurtransferase/DNA-binding transcriptional ArsR family regulator
MSSENPKHLLYSHFAALARALGNEHRLELLDHLSQGEWSVEELARRATLSVANASQHLHLLRRSGLVSSRKSGKNVLFRLADGPVFEAVMALRAVGEHNLAEVRSVIADYFERPDEMDAVSLDELRERMPDSNFLLLDVRDEAEYRQGHLPGAVHVPLEKLEANLAHLPPDREIIAYCRGPYCILSLKAVQMLRAHGFHSRRLEEGVAEWKATGGIPDTGIQMLPA